jgi:DNA-binding NarL/FixJ family response regulator
MNAVAKGDSSAALAQAPRLREAPVGIDAAPCLLRAIVANEDFLVREGIRRVLDGEDEIEVLESCPSLPSLLGAVEEHEPDVVISGIRMRPSYTDEGIRLATFLRDSHPTVGVVVVSQYLTPQYALDLFERGTSGRAYLLTEHVNHRIRLTEATREVANGGSVVDPAVVEVLIDARLRTENSPLLLLSAREREVLAGLSSGKSNQAIAQSLFLTTRAVEKNINAIFAKLGLTDDPKINRRVTAALLFLDAADEPKETYAHQ